MPRTSTRKKDILDATFRVLMEKGLPTLSFDAIATECNLSRQLVRYHFKDSDTLMVALLDELAARYRDTMIANVMHAKGESRINLFIDFYFDMIEGMRKPKDDQVYDALMALSVGSPEIRETLRLQYTLLGHVLSHEFALVYPDLGPQKAAELSFLFVNLMYGHWKMVASLGLSDEHKFITRGSGQNMGVIFVVAARAKVSSLRVGLPWTYGLQSKLPSTTGRSALISLTAFHDPTG